MTTTTTPTHSPLRVEDGCFFFFLEAASRLLLAEQPVDGSGGQSRVDVCHLPPLHYALQLYQTNSVVG